MRIRAGHSRRCAWSPGSIMWLPTRPTSRISWVGPRVTTRPQADLLLAAKHLGLKARASRSVVDRLVLAPLPALAVVRDPQSSPRVVVLAQCDGQRVLFQDPSQALQGGKPAIESLAAFAERWTGELVLITSRASLTGVLARFDFSWFVPEPGQVPPLVRRSSRRLSLFAAVRARQPAFLPGRDGQGARSSRPHDAERARHRVGRCRRV